MDVVAQVVAKWRSQGVRLNPGATPEALDELSSILGLPLPLQVRRFYELADGMVDQQTDEHLAEFWPISRIRHELRGGVWGDELIGFASVLIESWRFIFAVIDGDVHVLCKNVAPGDQPKDVGPFSTFLSVYLKRPQELTL